MSKLQRTAALSSSLIAVTLFFSAAYVASAATDTWSSSPSSANWNTANWTGGNNPPVAGDALAFGSSSTTTLNNDFAAGTAFDGIYFNGASAFILNGNNVLISGAASNTVGVMNTSGSSQTLGTLSLTLDWGNYTFSSSGSLALNGGLTVNTGGIAIFDGNETSTSLTADASGLISGLGGAGLTYSGGSAFTGLATISGGSISTYSSFGSVVAAPGSIGTATAAGAQNIELTATTAGNYTLANNPGITYANTISVSSATSTALVVGSTAGAQTLDVGAVSGIGGFYVVPSVTAQVLTIGSGSSTILTSGPETGPATPSAIVFAINGPGVGVNSAEINCSVQDNGSGGRVSLVKTGPGSMFFNGALTTFVSNTFTGGIYVDQGQFQSGNPGCFGTNSIYVGVGGTVYFNQNITNTNNIYLSPGNGAGTGAVVAGGAGLVEGGTGPSIYGGVITLQGAAVSSFPPGTISTPTGDTFSGNGTGATVNFTNQITGTGTFELTGAHSFTAVFKNTSANVNNWQGGMIIGGHSGVAVNELVKMGATNQIPNGPGTGDISFNPANSSGNAYSILDLNGFNATVNALVGTAPNCGYGAIVTNNGSATPCTLTIGANNDSATYNGDIGDGGSAKALSLIKIGTGTQTFGGNVSNFHGSITVDAGTLAFTGGGNTNNPANASSFTIAAGGVLDVSGLGGGGFSFGSSQTVNCTGQINGSDTLGGTFDTFLGTIGTFTNNGTLTLSSGSSYVWNVNNFTGTAGSDPGWSKVNVLGALQVTATSGSPINLNITSLSGDVPGNAANFNGRVSGSWIIATATGGITGFTGPSQFSINTSSFSNLPASAAKWSVGLTNGGNALALNYTSVSVIGVGLTDQTNNAGTTANYSVTASVSGTTPPVAFQWMQGVTVLVNGGTSASGGAVTITTNSLTSTLSIANVQDADAGGITVNVTDSASDSGSSSATLTVIDPPTGAAITQVGNNVDAGGNLANLQATVATGTMPFTYTWFLNGVAITNSSSVSGVGTSNLMVQLLPSQDGVYTVVIANSAGSSSNSFTLGPVTSVLGQAIFEPFTSYVAQTFPPGGADTWEGVTNLYNQITGSPAWWFHSSGSGTQMIVQLNDLGNGTVNRNGGTYPWPGLAGNSSNELYWTTSLNSHLEFGQTEGFPPGTKVYCSFILACDQGSSLTVGQEDVLAGFTSSDSGTAFNLKLCSVVTNAGQFVLGVAKGTGPNAQSVDANTLWEPGVTSVGQAVFVVMCYTVVSGGATATDDTVSMWVNPSSSTFYASEASAPAPDLGPISFGLTNSEIRDFAVHAVNQPASHRIADLRIGTTWASVTPPSAPTLSLGNVYAPVGTTATLTSANAGNPVLNYGWQHNGGAALTDGSTGHGSTISGSGTYSLTIANVQPADYGLYTVNGTNIDLSPANSPTNLTGAASALLTGQPPSLSATRSGANVIIAWPTNWVSYVLQQTPSVSPTSWTTNSLSPYPVIGTNNAVTVPVTGGTQEYYRLSNH